jgi:ribosome-associated protein
VGKEIATIARRNRKSPNPAEDLVRLIETSLEDDQAIDPVVISLARKSSIADYMIIATGRSQRHVGAMAEHLVEKLKATGSRTVPVEGMSQGDWVLVDAGDAIVHLFRSEIRAHYNLEKMWSRAAADAQPAELIA